MGPERFVDSTEIVRTQRMVKSEAEIAKIARVCETASDTFEALPEFVRAGGLGTCRLCKNAHRTLEPRG